MIIKEGYVYHIKDEYFDKVKDEKLMRNKERGSYRPTFLCIKDPRNIDLLWVIPMSSQLEKYQSIILKQEEKHGKCITLVIGKFNNMQSVFLIQNMFPITKRYLDHIHTINGNPISLSFKTSKQIKSNFQKVLHLSKKGYPIVFPDIERLEKIMLDELEFENQNHRMKISV